MKTGCRGSQLALKLAFRYATRARLDWLTVPWQTSKEEALPLRSKLFRGDPALEACLVKDSAHLTPGVVGEHVGKIQRALLLLENANIGPDEFSAKKYSSTTASAVLAYKAKRRIINFSYQTHPDNIVGKMTLAALDQEMAIMEGRGAGRPACVDQLGGGGAGGDVSPRSSSFAGKPVRSLIGDQIVPKTLSIKWQRTSAADAGRNADLFKSLVGRAGELVAQFGMLISHNGDGSSLPIRYPHVIQVDHTDALILRKAANKAFPAAPNVLQVIVCPFPQGDPAFGFTSGRGIDPFQALFPNYILINVNKSRDDKGTLLHEMIHAATDLPESSHDKIKESIFSIELNRTTLRPEHALALNGSFFAS